MIIRLCRVIGLVVLLFMFSPEAAHVVQAATESHAVVIYGCGVSGVAAGIQSGRLGADTILVEPTDMCGGQLTAAGECNLDESFAFGGSRPLVYENKQLYSELRQRLIATYGGEQYVHQGLYQDFTISCEPHVARDVIMRWFAEERAKGAKIDIFFNRTVQSTVVVGGKLTAINVLNAETGKMERYDGAQIIDASEQGDVIRLSGAYYRTGKDLLSGNAVPTDSYIQSITYLAIVQQFAPGQTPVESRFSQPPPGWTEEISKGLDQWFTNGSTPWSRGEGAYPYPKDLSGTKAYRGMPRILNPDIYKANRYDEARKIQKAAINFVANDVPVLSKYGTDMAYRQQMNCEAAIHTMYILYKFQLLGWDLAVTSEEGYQNSSYRQRTLCTAVPAELKNIELRLPLVPYIREANRLVGPVTLASATIRYQQLENYQNATGAWRGFNDPASIGVCGYPMDVHGGKAKSDLDLAIDDPHDLIQENELHSRYQIPLTALYPIQGQGNSVVDGLIAAEKNLSLSRGAAASVRTQPCSMLTGQASGALAALAARRGVPTSQITPEEVRQAIGYREVSFH